MMFLQDIVKTVGFLKFPYTGFATLMHRYYCLPECLLPVLPGDWDMQV